MGGREAALGLGAKEGALLGEYRSGDTGGSHPAGINVPDLPPGVRPISHSHAGLR